MATAVKRVAASARDCTVEDILATVPAWWGRRATEAGLDASWQSWQRAFGAPASGSSGDVVDELLDVPAHAFGDAYVAALDATTRLSEGRHYTPARLAAVLWDELARAGWDGGAVADPACGAGSLLVRPLRHVIASGGEPHTVLARARAMISGTDLDPAAVRIGNTVLGAELLPVWARLRPDLRSAMPSLLSVADGLTERRDAPTAIVMNPPYGRVRLEQGDRERWEPTLYGHANRYALFLQAAIERVAAGGFVAALVPTSFLGGSYYRRLREFVAANAPMVRLTFVDSRSGVFGGDVLQETCIAVFRKGRARNVACSEVAVNGSVRLRELPSAPRVRLASGPWLIPRRRDDGPLLAAAAKMPTRLENLGWRASTGPLVWNRYRPQIAGERREGAIPILWAADVGSGTVVRSREREGQRWFTPHARDDFMQLSETAVLVKRTTAPEQPRRVVAAILSDETLAAWGGTVVVENHVNVLRRISDDAIRADTLATLLNTETVDRIYRCLTGTVAVSAYELGAIPFPRPEELEALSGLDEVDAGRMVARIYGDDAA